MLFRDRVRDFIEAEVRPRQAEYHAQVQAGERWTVIPVIDELKEEARRQGLWNLFMPPASPHHPVDDGFAFEGEQLTNLEYALCAEEMGRIPWSSEVFNCSAPDTGDMEVLHRYGTRDQEERWLAPLMRGDIRSAFLMTEPDVASSDLTNIRTVARRDADGYVIDGRKWWSSGLGDPGCAVVIVMALKIIDDAVQAHGGAGLCGDFPLAAAWAHMRTLHLADGPDEVRARAIARSEFGKHREDGRR